TSLATCALSARSQGQTCTREPSSAASFSSLSTWRPETATVAPCLCSARAIPPPMPPVAPVTSAVLSVSSNICWRPLLHERGQSGFDDLHGAHRDCAERRGDALGEPGQHLARADLVELGDAVGGHAHDALAPAHGARHLLDEAPSDLRRIGDGR